MATENTRLAHAVRTWTRWRARPKRGQKTLKTLTASLAALAMAGGLALVSAGPASASPIVIPIAVNTYNWSGSAGYGSRPPALTEDSHGVVHLQGALKQISTSGSNANLLGCTGTAPLCGYAPPGRSVYTIAHTLGGTYADIAIDSSGNIWLIPSPNTDPGFVSLEGISHSIGSATGGPVSQVQLASNWYSYTPQYNYGASTASWWEDSNQTVHFEGGVQELTKTSGWAQLIGWIPTYAAPWQGTVYTIVHTLGGTYADLSINDNGQIWLLPSSNTNSGFVSLEGVTFSRLGSGGFHPIGAVSGWAPNACCGGAPLGWYKDPDGVVHLEGALTQVGTTADNPGRQTWVNAAIAKLDPTAAPSSWVYTIVHTYEGTYADLAIAPDGTIILLGTQQGGSLFTETYYVSLDGVTYQQ